MNRNKTLGWLGVILLIGVTLVGLYNRRSGAVPDRPLPSSEPVVETPASPPAVVPVDPLDPPTEPPVYSEDPPYNPPIEQFPYGCVRTDFMVNAYFMTQVKGDNYLSLPLDILNCAEKGARYLRLSEAAYDKKQKNLLDKP